jgi:hypothetical protein
MAQEQTPKMKSLVMPRVKLVNKGDSVQGFFKGMNEVQGKKGLYHEAILLKEDGTAVTIALGVVADKIFSTLVGEGQLVKVTLQGQTRSGGGYLVNEYDIQVPDVEAE